MEPGIIFAVLAMLSWGFGDFLIQRSTRQFGNWETIFLITFFGLIVLFPFVYNDLGPLISGGGFVLAVLVLTGFIHLVGALFQLESLRVGKISVVEPIWSFEIPAAALFALLILGERLEISDIILIILLMFGLILVSWKGTKFRKILFEPGVFVAFAGAIGMGLGGFFTGWGARLSDPLMINFFTCVVLTAVSATHLFSKGKLGNSFAVLWKNPRTLGSMIILDNTAWIAYAYAMSAISIGVATALSESYIIIAVLLGILVNRERLVRHQRAGLVIALISAIVLAVVTGN